MTAPPEIEAKDDLPVVLWKTYWWKVYLDKKKKQRRRIRRIALKKYFQRYKHGSRY